MIIGIIGFGFVGSAINDYFINKDCIIYKYDKYKNLDKFEDILKSDIIYISVPTVYDTFKKEYDLNPLIENLEKLAIFAEFRSCTQPTLTLTVTQQ